MANLHLVTGFAGYEHVTSADHGVFHSYLFGTGQFVFDRGSCLAASVVSNNLIRILDGDIYMQGRHIRMNEGTYVDLTIENGEQGKLRHDLIVARYTKDSMTAVEEVNLVVIKGTPVDSDPADPAYNSGNILDDNVLLNDMPLYRVPLNGLNVGEPVVLFGDVFSDSMMTLPGIRESVENIHKEVDEKIDGIETYQKHEILSDETRLELNLPEDSLPDDAFKKVSERLKIVNDQAGDVKFSVRTDLGDEYLLCNEEPFDPEKYPDAQNVIDPLYSRWWKQDGIAFDPAYPAAGLSLAYGQGVYAYVSAVSGYNVTIKYSADLIDWQETTVQMPYQIVTRLSLFYDKINNVWICYAIASSKNVVMSAPSLTTSSWTGTTLSGGSLDYTNPTRFVAFDEGEYSVALMCQASTFLTKDGYTWETRSANGVTGYVRDILYYKNKYYILSQNSTTDAFTEVYIYKAASLGDSTAELITTIAGGAASNTTNNGDRLKLKIVDGKLFCCLAHTVRVYADETFSEYVEYDLHTAAGGGGGNPSNDVIKHDGFYIFIQRSASGSYGSQYSFFTADIETGEIFYHGNGHIVSNGNSLYVLNNRFVIMNSVCDVLPCVPLITLDGSYVYICMKEAEQNDS